nr:MAG TPA: hypothetical protein [Caudoviricetes sp.]
MLLFVSSILSKYTYMLRKWFAIKGKKTFITNSKSLQRAYMLSTCTLFLIKGRYIYLIWCL